MTFALIYDPSTGAVKETVTICSTAEHEAEVLAALPNAVKVATLPTPAQLKTAKVDPVTKKLTGLPSGPASS